MEHAQSEIGGTAVQTSKPEVGGNAVEASKPVAAGSSSKVAMDIDKEGLIWMLAEDNIRLSEEGASFASIVEKLKMEASDVRRIIDELISDGSVYTTIDEEHFKLCLDSVCVIRLQ